MNQCWWLYLLVCRDGRTYAGIAIDVAARFAAHSSGKGAKFTRANPPVRVLGAQAFASRSEALKAEAALKKLGVYDAVEPKLVLGDNVLQAAQFVESGSADVGVFALSLALSNELRKEGRYWQVPLDAYPRLEQGGVILPWAQDEGAAREFCSFLKGEEARKILDRYGFLLPGE